jgi:tetratricopeptide (TPR) repeat protein
MPIPDWQKLTFTSGIVPERVPGEDRIVLWLPEVRQEGMACWERIATVAGAEISIEQGICTVAATSIRARKRGLFGKIWKHFWPGTGAQVWTLPNSQSAEQVGARRTDLALAWAEDESLALDEERIKSRWPKSQGFQKLAENLFLIRGVEPPHPSPAPLLRSVEGVGGGVESPLQLAEQTLVTARRAGDPRHIATALTDLGIVLTRQGHSQRAISLLEEARTIARQLSDSGLESDVLDNLGMAALSAGQPRRALELFQQGLERARAAGDRFAEKMALFHLGLASSAGRDLNQAFAFLEQALAIARQVGDRQHEADLLWHLGIVHAEASQRDQAVAKAQEAIDLFEQMGNPQADWLESQLQKYRAGEIGVPQGAAAPAAGASAPFFGGQIVASGWTDSEPWQGQMQGTSGPGLLRMAFAAMKSMARFAGSGFKAAPASIYQKRLQTCGQCQHHTGLRCKVCGCFTSVKAWMPHEECPIGKWPS